MREVENLHLSVLRQDLGIEDFRDEQISLIQGFRNSGICPLICQNLSRSREGTF
jgi:hypothetical protein